MVAMNTPRDFHPAGPEATFYRWPCERCSVPRTKLVYLSHRYDDEREAISIAVCRCGEGK